MSMSNQGQGLLSHVYLGLYVVFLYKSQISGERLQDHWSSGICTRSSHCESSGLVNESKINLLAHSLIHC